MSEYIITKRTECDRCLGGRRKGFERGCLACDGEGVLEYPIDADEWLLSRLAKLRWDGERDKNTCMRSEMQMENPRFDGDEG